MIASGGGAGVAAALRCVSGVKKQLLGVIARNKRIIKDPLSSNTSLSCRHPLATSPSHSIPGEGRQAGASVTRIVPDSSEREYSLPATSRPSPGSRDTERGEEYSPGVKL